MLADGADIHVEERADELLREPDGLALDADLDTAFSGLRSEHEELAGAIADAGGFSLLMT